MGRNSTENYPKTQTTQNKKKTHKKVKAKENADSNEKMRQQNILYSKISTKSRTVLLIIVKIKNYEIS